MTEGRYLIGKAAVMAGVTNRTLRYYQELGLIDPATSPAGTRIYSDRDVERLKRIIQLRDVVGLDLERIAELLRAEDRLEELRTEVRHGTSPKRRQEIIQEAIAVNAHMLDVVAAKLEALQAYLDELTADATRYRAVLDRERTRDTSTP
ncbi:MAG TPA: MerR family transcriptional regulator [Acidimicrobiales bacterium]|nr:MerR family transcriptional regulator [Acidimicrobiales bacterium]